MTEILTGAEMRALEQRAMDSGAVTGRSLMERAGLAVVEAIEAHWPEYKETPQSASVLCGPGNNGGDGFVIARLLRERGWTVTVYAAKTAPTARDALAARAAWGSDPEPLTYEALHRAPDAALYVDAIFGIGLSRPPVGDLADLLRYLAGSGGDGGYFQPRMVAVDVPSGLDADRGCVPGVPAPNPFDCPAPFAALTVTFDSPKPGHFLADGPALCGKLVVADIGLQDDRCTTGGADTAPKTQRPIGMRLFPPLANVPDSRIKRPFDIQPATRLVKRGGHKFTHGHVLVLSGPMGRSGAARLAARGALRVGAGLVTLAAPGSALMECATQLTAIMLRRCDGPEDLQALLSDQRLGTICLGPGLGEGARALTLAALAAEPARSVVLDADALTAFAQTPDALFDAIDARSGRAGPVVLTPHTGEFARLFPDIYASWQGADGAKPRSEAAEQHPPALSKPEAVAQAARRAGTTVLLKGPDTVICTPLGTQRVTGKPVDVRTLHAACYDRCAPWLATAGSGDVLSGFIAGLLARGLSGHQAAETAAWLHVECARAFGPGLIAEDLPEMVPRVISQHTDAD